MKNEINNLGEKIIVMINGQMDTLGTIEFEQNIYSLLQKGNPDICIDCSNLQYINSNDIRILMVLLKYIRSLEGRLFFIKMRPEVKYILDMTGFSTFIDKEK